MVARVTLAEVDIVRTSLDAALELYRSSVIPALHAQPGYEGCYVLTTPGGKALVMTLWSDEAAADARLASGHYSGQVEKFATFYRSPPGRDTYAVGICRGAARRSLRSLTVSKLFGIPIETVLIVLLAAMAVALGAVACSRRATA